MPYCDFSAKISDYDVVIWDLDGTIYDECQFLFSVYQNFSNHFECRKELFAFLTHEFLSEGRVDIVKKAFDSFNVNLPYSDFLQRFLREMRNFNGELVPNELVIRLMKEISLGEKKQAIITNGNVEQQKRKVQCLGLIDLFPDLEVVYANQYDPKPSVKSFEIMTRLIEIGPLDRVLYVGDSDIDKSFAENCGISFLFISDLYLD